MLVVEVDGGTHSTDEERATGAIRTAALKQLGYRVHRVWNGDVYDNLDVVVDHLLAILGGHRPLGRPNHCQIRAKPSCKGRKPGEGGNA